MSDIAQSKAEQSLKIQFVSDLHLEFPDNRAWLAAHPLEVTGDILLIAGDSAYLDLPDSGRETYKAYDFWDWAARNYKQVIVCLGNHDFYGYYYLSTMPDGYCLDIRPNVKAYYNQVLHLTAEGGPTAKQLYDYYLEAVQPLLARRDYRGMRQMMAEAVKSFDAVCDHTKEVTQVGVVGEIYVKYNSFSNKEVIKWLIAHGVEVVPPAITGFFSTSVPNAFIFKNQHIRQCRFK
jgi:hypothetical protein